MRADITYDHQLRADSSVLSEALRDAEPTPYWLSDPSRPKARPAVSADIETDLIIVGGGFCGLWTALIAKERNPGRRVVLLEGQRIGWAASGRNGGFCEASLTHGIENGELHFEDDLPVISELAIENFRAISDTIARYGIDAEWEETGVLRVATEPHQVEGMYRSAVATGQEVLTGGALDAVTTSPVYRAGVLLDDGFAFVHPTKLAWGLAEAAEGLGVEIYEHSPASKLATTARGVSVKTPNGTISAQAVALATNAFPSLLPALRLFTVPVYDYVLMTEPLSAVQLASIGWTGRHGITDSSREFHYYRKSADDRILFGGYDAVYHRGGKVSRRHDQRPVTFERLADHFFTTFPQLEGIRFTHKWGGAIDMTTQLAAFHGSSHGGRVAFSAGYTGLGVGATRFGAETMLDFLEKKDTVRTRLKMSRRLPIPIPPEPFAYPLIQLMRRAVARSDRRGGRDGLLLKLAGIFKIGFDS